MSKTFHVQEEGCFVSRQCYSRGVTTLPELLHCVAWIHHSASASSELLTSLHYEGISPAFNTQWTSISHTMVLEFGILDLKIKEDILTVNTTATYYASLVKRSSGVLKELMWPGKLT